VARIFTVLAVLALLLLAANFVVGLTGGNFNAAAEAKRAAQRNFVDAQRQARGAGDSTSAELDQAKQALAASDLAFLPARSSMTLHMLLGSAAALVAVLVNSIAITYFIGTSRWCKEVCETYDLPRELAERSTRLKRTTFPWALAGILSVIAIIGLGAAADPTGANFSQSASFVMPHYLAAIIGLLIVAIAFWIEISRIAENYTVIDEILGEVSRVRAEKNLPQEELAAP
jgi:hypothetical protein